MEKLEENSIRLTRVETRLEEISKQLEKISGSIEQLRTSLSYKATRRELESRTLNIEERIEELRKEFNSKIASIREETQKALNDVLRESKSSVAKWISVGALLFGPFWGLLLQFLFKLLAGGS